jgi:hypothetical protein
VGLQEDFVALQISYMRQIVGDHCRRRLEPRGIWYAIDYFRQGGRLGGRVRDGSTFHGFAPEDYFAHLKDSTTPTGKRIYSFATKRGKSPCESLRHLLQSFSFLDCGTVCYLASSLALAQCLGGEAFDQRFSPEGANRFILTGDAASSAASVMTRQLIRSEEEILKGDIVYFSNCKEYVAKHPAGEARGFNVLCSEEKPHKYLGLGLLEESSREEVEKSLWRSFNEEPVDLSFYTPEIWNHFYTQNLLCDLKKSQEIVEAFRTKTLSWEEYQRRPARLKNSPMDGKMELWVYRVSRKFLEGPA